MPTLLVNRLWTRRLLTRRVGLKEELASRELADALKGTAGAPSATNRFVTEQDYALLKANRASVVHPDRSRTYYPSHSEALVAAQAGDTVVLPAPIAAAGLSGVQAQIALKPGVSLHTMGFDIGNATTTGDAINLATGRSVIVGDHSTVCANSPGAWGLGGGGDIDCDVYDLHIVNRTSHAIYLVAGPRLRYRGRIVTYGEGIGIWARRNARVDASGSVRADTTGQALYVSEGSTLTYTGKLELTDRSTVVASGNSTLRLERCLVDGASERAAGAALLVNAADSTVVLTDATVLGTAGQVAVTARRVVLRGSTVVTGTIQAAELVDERPAATPPAPTPADGGLALPVPRVALLSPSRVVTDEALRAINSVRVVFDAPLPPDLLALNPEIWLFRYNQRRRRRPSGWQQRAGWGHPAHRDGARHKRPTPFWTGYGREPFDTEFFAPELVETLRGDQPYMDLPIRVSQWMHDPRDGSFLFAAKAKRGRNHRFRFALVLDAPAEQPTPSGKLIGPLSDEVWLGNTGQQQLAFRPAMYNHA